MWFSVNEKLPVDQMWFNFLPSWWNKNYGVTFGERFIFDPDYRIETYLFLERTLAQRFPSLHLGSKNPKPTVIAPELYNATTPAAAGCKIPSISKGAVTALKKLCRSEDMTYHSDLGKRLRQVSKSTSPKVNRIAEACLRILKKRNPSE